MPRDRLILSPTVAMKPMLICSAEAFRTSRYSTHTKLVIKLKNNEFHSRPLPTIPSLTYAAKLLNQKKPHADLIAMTNPSGGDTGRIRGSTEGLITLLTK